MEVLLAAVHHGVPGQIALSVEAQRTFRTAVPLLRVILKEDEE